MDKTLSGKSDTGQIFYSVNFTLAYYHANDRDKNKGSMFLAHIILRILFDSARSLQLI